jgi:exodeoxyribonuclease VII small subunit
MDTQNPSESLAALEQLSYEEALARLESIVSHLERGDLSLEASMERFEDGIALSRVCAKKLAVAEARIQKLVDGANGEMYVEPIAAGGSQPGGGSPP